MNEIILTNTRLPIVSSCDFLAAPEPFYHADRITNFHVMIYVTDGCIYVTEDDIDYAVRPGELLFLKKGIRHFGKKEIERGTRWHYVHFYLDSQENQDNRDNKNENAGNEIAAIQEKQAKPTKTNQMEAKQIKATQTTQTETSQMNQPKPSPMPGSTVYLTEHCPQPLKLTLPKTLTGLSCSQLEAQIVSFTDSFHDSAPQNNQSRRKTDNAIEWQTDMENDWQQRWNINQRFFQLLTEAARHNQSDEHPFSLADKIAQYLTAHYAEPFSAALLEQHFFLSYKHMAAVFKKEKHLTMQQFHTQVRMDIACKLLRSTLLPIGEISLRVGYQDMLYFSRCFHSIMGMSPTEYRRQPPAY